MAGPVAAATAAPRLRKILIQDERAEQSLLTDALTVGAALQAGGVSITVADSVEPPMDALVTDATVIRITRAHPLTIDADGVQLQHYSSLSTVGAEIGRAHV